VDNDLAGEFPGGRFSDTQCPGNASLFPASGATVNPDVRSDSELVSDVTEVNQTTVPGYELLLPPERTGLGVKSGINSHPTLSDPNTYLVVFQLFGPPGHYRDLDFLPVNGFAATAPVDPPARQLRR
jgi:hypothetical protein